MNRREFLKRLAALGCVAVAPKIIFDMGAHSYLSQGEDWDYKNLENSFRSTLFAGIDYPVSKVNMFAEFDPPIRVEESFVIGANFEDFPYTYKEREPEIMFTMPYHNFEARDRLYGGACAAKSDLIFEKVKKLWLTKS